MKNGVFLLEGVEAPWTARETMKSITKKTNGMAPCWTLCICNPYEILRHHTNGLKTTMNQRGGSRGQRPYVSAILSLSLLHNPLTSS
jgi:hypothetical protein